MLQRRFLDNNNARSLFYLLLVVEFCPLRLGLKRVKRTINGIFIPLIFAKAVPVSNTGIF